MNYETTVTADRAEGYAADFGDEEAEARTTRRRRLIVIGVIVLIVLGGIAFFAVRGGGNGSVGPENDQSQLPVITVVTPGKTTIEGEIEASGTLSARRRCRSARWARADA